MKISIITVSFNRAKTIRQTIESVLAQDYDDLEYIVIDGASTDGTVEILESFGNKITFISEPDKGIYDALNKGVKLATGEVIGTIGGDDFYPNPQVISHIAKTFEEAKTDAVYGDKQYVNMGDDETIVRYWRSGEYVPENWLKGWMPPHLSFYLKKSAFLTFGYYITDFTCSGGPPPLPRASAACTSARGPVRSGRRHRPAAPLRPVGGWVIRPTAVVVMPLALRIWPAKGTW